jgi:hypothetical protein
MPPSAKALGIRLIVRLGSTLLPPPPELLNAITSVNVTNEGSGQDGFSITFTLTRRFGDYNLLVPGLLDPPKRVVIGVAMGVVPEVLIDGVITHHQVSPSADPGASTLTVMGRDFSEVMNFAEQNQQYKNQPDDVIFRQIIARYSEYGAVPVAAPALRSPPIELVRTPTQTKTDLAYIRELAGENGYVFYIEPITFGANTAYFGPQVRGGPPQRALTFNMGAASNVTSINFSHDALAESVPTGQLAEPNSGVVIPIPPVPTPKVPPLGLQRTVLRTTIQREVGNLPLDQAIIAQVRAIMSAPDAVQGSGQLDAVRYGSVLRARKLVGVRGVGARFDGLYYVNRVTHAISRTSYSQQFSLSREALYPTVPAVIP